MGSSGEYLELVQQLGRPMPCKPHQKRLVDLFQLMSEELTHVSPRDPAHGFAVQRQLQRMRKRARLDSPGLDRKAIANFEAINDRVGDLAVVLDPFIEHNARIFIYEAFERFNRRSDQELANAGVIRQDDVGIQIPFDYRHVIDKWRFGPGASNGVKGTHTADKILQPMSCTAPAEYLVKSLRYGNAYFRRYDNPSNSGTIRVEGSRLTTVPKNEDIHRTIAIEPSGNMALQLALGRYIEDVLRSIGLDISDQQLKNKALAWAGSCVDDFATIDMTSASDMFHPKLVRKLLPKELFRWMMHVRSPATQLPDGRWVQLNMMSTMGNGFTFPMMTLIFVALIYATRLKRGGPSKYIDWNKTAVFGDDIIVPKSEAPDLIEVLEGCGFIINHEKSYLDGPFRESCGGDFYNGTDVTPVYIKELTTNASCYAALNGLFEWCARQQTLLPRSLEFIASCVKGDLFFVPEWCGNDAGFRTTQVLARRYKHLRPVAERRKLENDFFALPLICGGYVEPRARKGTEHTDLFFTPRPFKTRYKVKKSRLPRGYLDGRDPFSRSDSVSAYVEAYSFLLKTFH